MTDFTTRYRRTTYAKISPANSDQTGRTVLVTGASESIGFNIAAAFAEANASTVIISSRSRTKLDNASAGLTERFPGTNILTQLCDVSSAADCQNLWARLADQSLIVDVLVLNAGATEQPENIDDTLKNLQLAISGNVVLSEGFREQNVGEGRQKVLINISSAGMHCYPSVTQQTIYHVGKAGFAAYIAHATEAIPETEMRMVSLHPGCVFTSAVARMQEDHPGLDKLPIWDDLSLSAHMAVWCAGPEAGFLHGRFIWANWDVEELLQMKEEIDQHAGLLRIGFIGVNAFSMQQLMQRCAQEPVPTSR